jgi:hypothetical protein
MDWLSEHSPMHIHWGEKWLQSDYLGKPIKLKGIQPSATMAPLISASQPQAMHKRESILYMVQLGSVPDNKPPTEPIPMEIQSLIQQYQQFFFNPYLAFHLKELETIQYLWFWEPNLLG